MSSLQLSIDLARRDHALAIFIGTAHAATNLAELEPDLHLLRQPDPRVDDVLLVGWEGVSLGVLELEEAGVENHAKKHVEDVVWFDDLLRKYCKVESILEADLEKFEALAGASWLLNLIALDLNYSFIAVTKYVVEVSEDDTKMNVGLANEQYVVCFSMFCG